MDDKKQFSSIDEYISTFPKETQAILEKVRQTIKKAAPETEETISYGIPAFKLDGKYVVYFAGWKHHISIYPLPAGNEAFQKELAPHISGKGTAQFPLDKPIPYDLVEKIATYLLKERLDRTGY